jgi:sensor c-di-GMP phosphodiesterase-like protein
MHHSTEQAQQQQCMLCPVTQPSTSLLTGWCRSSCLALPAALARSILLLLSLLRCIVRLVLVFCRSSVCLLLALLAQLLHSLVAGNAATATKVVRALLCCSL